MKHVTFADKAVLMGDDAADVLLEYAQLIAETETADTVTLAAISPDGNTVQMSFLLNSNTVLMIESTNTDLDAPDNTAIVSEIRQRIEMRRRPVRAEPAQPWSDQWQGDESF